MKARVNRLIVLCVLALLALPAAAQQFKLGYLDNARLQRETKRPQRDAENLKKEFAAREQQLRAMREKGLAMQAEFEKLGPAAPAAELERKRRELANFAQDFEQARRTLAEDVDRRRAEERDRFIRDVRAVVQKIVMENAIYASRAIDITDQVIKAIDGGK
jgi:outer membrane protein